uniref:Uncharacterized protein n=1 Tax=Lepeophtheirus salmonis TaxID=72036 RepID=A0A0K2UDA4_LEPSM
MIHSCISYSNAIWRDSESPNGEQSQFFVHLRGNGLHRLNIVCFHLGSRVCLHLSLY